VVVRLAVLIVLLVACARPPLARFDKGVFSRGKERFRVREPDPAWRRITSPAGDLAWEHRETHAVIAADATCRGHKDPPPAILLNDLLIGTTERKVLLDEIVRLDERNALHQVVSARLDGVTMVFDLYVLKKDGCVYDLALLARPRAYDRVADTFVEFVIAFRGLGKGSS
jgi:hypothetical protein